MRRLLLLLAVLTLSANITNSQDLNKNQLRGLEEAFRGNKNEIYFKIDIKDKEQAVLLGKTISVDHNSNDQVCYAYADKQDFQNFLKLGIDYTILPHPNSTIQDIQMLTTKDLEYRVDWNRYPTYEAYEQMMLDFASKYPSLCKVYSFKTLASGRKLYMAHITKDVDEENDRPEFLYTAQMHGDEVVTYMLMLRLIDHLLSQYGTDDLATKLVDNIDIHINPLANPDGTYRGGNNSIYRATRSNANNVDLNRNFPDPEDGRNPDGKQTQPETLAFMSLADDHHFVMSGNLHSGVELINYPWDTWAKRHPDNNWWIYQCEKYANSAQKNSPDGYFDDENNGITNGFDWYEVAGGRQDYMNYFHNCREITLEHSGTKILAENTLDNHWTYNKEGLLNYMEQVLFGVSGKVTDKATGQVIKAKVVINNHDIDNSFIYSDAASGKYYRPIKEGTYDISFIAEGYAIETIKNVEIKDNAMKVVDVQLTAKQAAAYFSSDKITIEIGDKVQFTSESLGTPDSYEWTFEGGIPATSTEKNPKINYSKAGKYKVSLKIKKGDFEDTYTVENCISVYKIVKMRNTEVTVSSGLFTDDGGIENVYGKSKSYTMVINPEIEDTKVKLEFTNFYLEESENCKFDYLKIYDGTDKSNLIGTYCGTNSPDIIIADTPSGALTIEFSSDRNSCTEGWQAIVSNVRDTNVTEVNTDINVYPNPATDQLNIVMDIKGAFSYQIYSINGTLKLNGVSNTHKIKLSGLSKGLYLLKVSNDDKVYRSKFICE
ncbi:MAG: M14 family zinc carboxypeptidase [Hyphomicrobiales bacterium]